MIPNSMKQPWWLAPACILSLTAGIFLFLVYFWPDFAPQLHENMFRRGVYVIIPFIAGVNIMVPTFCLWCCIQMDKILSAGENVEEDY